MPGAMPQDHARALREQGPVSRRLKLIGAIGTVLSIAVLVVVLTVSTSGHLARGCFSTFLPGPIGAIPDSACGAAARSTCSHLRVSRQLTAKEVQILADACRAAHIPVAAERF